MNLVCLKKITLPSVDAEIFNVSIRFGHDVFTLKRLSFLFYGSLWLALTLQSPSMGSASSFFFSFRVNFEINYAERLQHIFFEVKPKVKRLKVGALVYGTFFEIECVLD